MPERCQDTGEPVALCDCEPCAQLRSLDDWVAGPSRLFLDEAIVTAQSGELVLCDPPELGWQYERTA